jgi:hypothetical protein
MPERMPVSAHFTSNEGLPSCVSKPSYDLAVCDEVLWHFNVLMMGVYHHIGRTIVVHNPLVEGTDEIWAIRQHIQ